MSEKLLNNIRKLNWVLSESTKGYISFNELCTVLSKMLTSNVYILNRRGKVLAAKFNEGEESPLEKNAEGVYVLPEDYNERFLETRETKANLTYDAIRYFYGSDYEMADKYHTIVPIIFGGARVATILVARPEKAYDDEDIAICEYGATVVGIEVSRNLAIEEEQDIRRKKLVSNALETLSYSEMDAVTKIFDEMDGDEDLIVASNIADKSGITRSVIVNALRILESAGIIESRSLGMKGTRIKIINPYLRDEIRRMNR